MGVKSYSTFNYRIFTDRFNEVQIITSVKIGILDQNYRINKIFLTKLDQVFVSETWKFSIRMGGIR